MTDEEFNEKWESLSKDQKEFVRIYSTTTTKASAAREAGIAPQTVYNWDAPVYELAEEIVNRRTENLMNAVEGLSEEAVGVLRRALDPDTDVDRTTQETAEYIINRLEGKPTSKQEIEHSGGIDLTEEDVDDALDQL